MMKLRQRDRRALIEILTNLQQVQNYLDQPDILVCRAGKVATTTLHYINAAGDVCYPINKEGGSDLIFLKTAITRLLNELCP